MARRRLRLLTTLTLVGLLLAVPGAEQVRCSGEATAGEATPGETPERLLLTDRFLLIAGALWVCVLAAALYLV